MASQKSLWTLIFLFVIQIMMIFHMGHAAVRKIDNEELKMAGSLDNNLVKEYALARLLVEKGSVNEAGGRLSVWQPYVNQHDASRSLIRVALENPDGTIIQEIQAGWQVFPILYGDSRPRFYIRWTGDGYRSTGCYDLKCPGFVMDKDAQLYPGQVLTNISVHGDVTKQIELPIRIIKRRTRWEISADFKPVGYLPIELVQNLSQVNTVQYGGEVLVSKNTRSGHVTNMGSGDGPERGPGNAAHIRDMEVFTSIANPIYPEIQYVASHPECYAIKGDINKLEPWGVFYIYFGGPRGKTSSCK
ncbi:hypothetical protein SUGI_1107300 [Cryptomeria japonica]|nr:hypothetical protein SUGI_1107300 [Cryptomeria japonica]